LGEDARDLVALRVAQRKRSGPRSRLISNRS
jgi:hypothetical protein